MIKYFVCNLVRTHISKKIYSFENVNLQNDFFSNEETALSRIQIQ